MPWWESIRFEVSYAWLWALATPAVLWMARRYRIDRSHRAQHLLIHLIAMALIISVIKTVFDAAMMPPASAFHEFSWQRLFRSIEYTFDTGTLIYLVIILIEHTFVYYRRYQQGLMNASKLQTQLAQAQLQALKMRLHPHFLFNTLHTISALVHEDPELAERTIARLSELLRLFLANSAIHEVPLNEELRMIELYLEIEQTRFEDRLRVHYDVPDELREAMVPNLVLQPLVENAIRHGVGKKSETARISISAERHLGTLVLRVTDNGVGLNGSVRNPGQPGMGLGITRGRLESLYGVTQSLVLSDLKTGGVEAKITMPLRMQTEDAALASASPEQEEENAALQSTDH